MLRSTHALCEFGLADGGSAREQKNHCHSLRAAEYVSASLCLEANSGDAREVFGHEHEIFVFKDIRDQER